MDWMNRGSSSNQTTNQPAGHPGPVANPSAARGSSKRDGGGMSKLFRISSVVLLFASTILVLVLLVSVVKSSTSKKESDFVKTDKMQAVFLNGGQVYFGKIKSLNAKYMQLTGIYYLRVNQQVQPNQSTSQNNDISLVKLGCELHGPVDEMLINRDQITFWENLKTDGQVAKAVATYIQQNPNGQKCEQTTSNSNSSSSNATNSTTTTPTTNSTTTTNKKQ